MTTETPELETPAKGGGKRRIIMIAAILCVLLAGGGAFAWQHFHHPASHPEKPTPQPEKLTIITIPTMVSNLDTGEGRARYIRISARLQVEDSKDTAKIGPLMPQIQDAFQTCLHGMRPEELSGAGIYRLRETLLAQVSNILAPLPVRDLFFVELLVQ
ncbi:flagellar basal body-associated FliL family protein [Gluconobacter japonicus]|uniref:flagellar basal body-associated FliL family protein n=1 Tax=Gluconobacter japonicus TaxID=376620 RepID=UPI0024AD851B|nr:flagellar basal body-associated FliL family protein [Gluconobacter japonicus]MDI6653361.1 flagellar basal body-associated FliL family protein [Gluconobacter japonicus]